MMRSASHSPGGTGRLFPDATLPTRDGGSLSLDVFRPKWDLVMVMLGAGPVPGDVERLLEALAARRTDVEAEDGQVVAVTAAAADAQPDAWRWPFPLLIDANGRLHGRVDAVDADRRAAPALFVTDHYREIYGAMRPGEPGWPASADEVIEWLVFANIQCPECNVPEWEW
jgi:hypothetical protein